MCRSSVHPRTLSYKIARAYGRHQRRDDYSRPGIAYAIDQAFYNVSHGWRWMVGLGQFRLVFSLDSCFSYQSHVSTGYERFRRTSEQTCSFPARILVRRERLEDVKRVLGRIYPYATPEQVDLKVMVAPIRDGVAL
jgi:hypothetical protein